MHGFWPHDLLSWLTAGSILLGGLWWVLKNTVMIQIELLRDDLKDLTHELKKSNEITEGHELRIKALEEWRDILTHKH